MGLLVAYETVKKNRNLKYKRIANIQIDKMLSNIHMKTLENIYLIILTQVYLFTREPAHYVKSYHLYFTHQA